MTKETFYEVLSDTDDSYCKSARRKRHQGLCIAAAACVCILLLFLLPRNQHYDAPYMLQFQNADTLAVLLQAGQLTDAELEQFLQEEGFTTQLVTSRYRVEQMVLPLWAIGYPLSVSEFDRCTLTYLPGTYHALAYSIKDVSYTFVYTPKKTSAFRLGFLATATYKIGNKNVKFFQDKNGIVGEFYSGGYQVRITVRGYDSLDAVSFDHFRWIEQDVPY